MPPFHFKKRSIDNENSNWIKELGKDYSCSK